MWSVKTAYCQGRVSCLSSELAAHFSPYVMMMHEVSDTRSIGYKCLRSACDLYFENTVCGSSRTTFKLTELYVGRWQKENVSAVWLAKLVEESPCLQRVPGSSPELQIFVPMLHTHYDGALIKYYLCTYRQHSEPLKTITLEHSISEKRNWV